MSIKKDLDLDDITTAEAIGAAVGKANKPLKLDEILAIMKLPRRNKREVQRLLYFLEDEGTLIKVKGSWHMPKNRRLIKGTLAIQRSGVGFVIPESSESGNDIFISPQNIGEAWDGDLVNVMILPSRSGPNREGRIMEVLERSNKAIPATALRKDGDEWIAVPQSPGIQSIFRVDPSDIKDEIKKDDLILLVPKERIASGIHKGKIIKNLNDELSPPTQEYLAKVGNNIPMSFPSDVLGELKELPEDPDMADFIFDENSEDKAFIGQGRTYEKDPEAKLGSMGGFLRYDLRHLPFVTIDGADARDFDDAVYVEKLDGGYKLMVGIADVSYYVKEASAIDKEAILRGNSYYFPLSVEPMLPEALSNGLCSLNPHKARLAMVAEIYFDRAGKEQSSVFYRAIIESKGRLTYEQVYKAQKEKDPEAIKSMAKHMEMLDYGFELSELLSKKRDERGSLSFELPEAQFIFGKDGKVSNIIPRVQNASHKLIEEFMVAANEAVARFLTSRHAPILYRSHESPDDEKLAAFKLFIEHAQLAYIPKSLKRTARPSLGRPVSGKKSKAGKEERAPSPKEFMEIIQAVKGTPQEYTVNRLLLRAMMQAKYSPDTATHFGLASQCYCHFTSPIRRYSDLVVHRSLAKILEKESGYLNAKDWALPDDLKGNVVLDDHETEPKDKSAQKALKARQDAQSKQRSKLKESNEKFVQDLNTIADHINRTERVAMEAERETQKRLSALYLSDKIGEKFDGIVSGVTDFGIFVELPACLSEGMIRLGAMNDDYYEYHPERHFLRGTRTGKIYNLGKQIEVVLTDVVLSRQEINLLPTDIIPKEERVEQRKKYKEESGDSKKAKDPRNKASRTYSRPKPRQQEGKPGPKQNSKRRRPFRNKGND